MNCDYLNFMRVLEGKIEGKPTFFEPCLCDYNCEELIWRRGSTLWSTHERYIEAMISVRERTSGDVICINTSRYDTEALLYTAEKIMPENIKAVAICRTQNESEIAQKYDCVCAIGGYSDVKKSEKPFIRMDGDINSAINEGADGYFLENNIEKMYELYHEKITLLGGLGVKWLNSSNPRDIYDRVESIYKMTKNQGFATGSGSLNAKFDYLNLISMLGIYIRHK